MPESGRKLLAACVVAGLFGVAARARADTDPYYATGSGRSFFDVGDVRETAVRNQTIQSLRFTAALRVEKQSLILFQYQNDIAASDGASIARFFGARVSHFF